MYEAIELTLASPSFPRTLRTRTEGRRRRFADAVEKAWQTFPDTILDELAYVMESISEAQAEGAR
jgi:hypothetical protein